MSAIGGAPRPIASRRFVPAMAVAFAIGCALVACGDGRNAASAAVAPASSTAGATVGGAATASTTSDAPAPDATQARAESIYFSGAYDSARVLWRASLRRADADGDSAAQARALMWLGLASWRLGDYAVARTLGERSVELKLRLRLTRELSRSYNGLGLLARDEGRLADAAALFERAVQSARAVADTPGVARAAGNLGLIHGDLGEFAAARAGFEALRAASQAAGDVRGEGNGLTNLAMLDIRLGDPAAALPRLQEARRLYRSIEYGTGEQNALGQLATALELLGEPQQAFAVLDSANRLARAQGLRRDEADNLRILGELHQGIGDHQRALDHLVRARALSTELGLKQEIGIVLRAEARSQAALGRLDLARQRAEEAYQLHRDIGATYEAMTDLLLLAELAQLVGDGTAVGARLKSARVLAATLGTAGARADLALAEARVADRDSDAARVLGALDDARVDLSRARAVTEWEVQLLRARALSRLGRLDEAASAGRGAVAAAERVRGRLASGVLRVAYASDRAAAYGELADVLLRLGRVDEAFEVADAARGRAFLEHRAPATRTAVRAAARLAERQDLLRVIDTLTVLLQEAERATPGERGAARDEQARGLADRLAAARREYESLLARDGADGAPGEARAVSLLAGRARVAELRRALAPDEALVEYLVTPRRVHGFVLTRAGTRPFTSEVSEADLASRVRLARELLGARDADPAQANAVLGALHEALLAPARRAGPLRAARRLVVVPHGVLSYLPFAALRDAASGRYLVQDFALLHLPAAAALPALRGAARPDVAPAAAGAIVLAPFGDALPATRDEARSVRRIVAGTRILEGAAASERVLRDALGSAALVHVATHGVLNPWNPLFSRVELARAGGAVSGDDGRLEVHELLAMRVGSPLVFLSGCETGVGAAWSTQFARGEDFATLAQAFLFAGARDVVATLWRIDDAGTAALAGRFYRGLGDAATPEALAEAQRALLADRRFAAPYHWAGFQVSGAGARVPVKRPWWRPFD